MVFRKLRSLVVRQAQAPASKQTANNQPSSDDEQPEPILVRSPCSLPTAAVVLATVVTNTDHKKGRFLKAKQMKFPSLLLLTKAVKGENETPKLKTVQLPLN